jgi:hypothetical protein
MDILIISKPLGMRKTVTGNIIYLMAKIKNICARKKSDFGTNK